MAVDAGFAVIEMTISILHSLCLINENPVFLAFEIGCELLLLFFYNVLLNRQPCDVQLLQVVSADKCSCNKTCSVYLVDEVGVGSHCFEPLDLGQVAQVFLQYV